MAMNDLTNEFWERFSETRTDTLAVVSEKTGIPLATIKGWNSKGRLPKISEAIKIAEYLNVSLDWLILGKVVESEGNEASRVLQAYLGSDEYTKELVRRVLKLN